ncbi:MAG: efflux RND transporter periplasmic adaptor subunit [Duodenibacillus sp.]
MRELIHARLQNAVRFLSLSVLTAGLVFTLGGCQQKPAQQAPKKILKVSVVAAAPAAGSQWIETLGHTEGVRQAEVRAQVSGILQKISYREGDRVKAGDVLFELDPAPYKAALDAAVAQRRQVAEQLVQDEREARRYAELFAARAASRKELDNADSTVTVRKAQLASARAAEEAARINLERTRVTAPSDGIVGLAQVNPGTLVTSTSTLLANITQPDALRVLFSAGEHDLAGNPLDLNSRVRLRLASGAFVETQLDYVAAQMDVTTATRAMRALVPAQAGLLAGQLVHVQLEVKKLPSVYRVPQRSVFQKPDGSHQVYLAREGKAVAVTVKVGNWQDTDWIVTEGLAAGDAVIVDNVQRLRNGAPIEVVKKVSLAEASKVELTRAVLGR